MRVGIIILPSGGFVARTGSYHDEHGHCLSAFHGYGNEAQAARQMLMLVRSLMFHFSKTIPR